MLTVMNTLGCHDVIFIWNVHPHALGARVLGMEHGGFGV
jgi:hypothetical protein